MKNEKVKYHSLSWLFNFLFLIFHFCWPFSYYSLTIALLLPYCSHDGAMPEA